MGIRQAADSSSASFNKSRGVRSKLSGPQKRMWPLACQTGFRLWSVWRHWNTKLFPLWWEYTIPCISDHSYLSNNRNKQNKTKPWVPCWCLMRVPHIHPLTHWRGRNLPRTHNVLSENTGQPDLFLRSQFQSHPWHSLCPAFFWIDFWGQGHLPTSHHHLLLLLVTAPWSPKALAHPGFTQTPAFNLGNLNICDIIHRQIVKKNLYLVDNFVKP